MVVFFGAIFFTFLGSALATPHVRFKKAQGQGLWILRQVSPKVAHKKKNIFVSQNGCFFPGAIFFLFWGLGPGHLTSCRAGLGWPGLGGDGEEGHKREEGQKSKK